MLKIAYILDVFPVLSETFILSEMLELKKRGLNIGIFALSRDDSVTGKALNHADSNELVQGTTYMDMYIHRISGIRKAVLHFFLFLKRPALYIKALYYTYGEGRKTFNLFKTMPIYLHELRKRKISHIHAHYAKSACELSMLLSLVSEIQFSFSVHAFDIYRRDAKDIRKHIQRAVFVITCTAYNQKYLLKKYDMDALGKVYLNYHGVNIKTFNPSTKKPKGIIDILSIGRLVEKKGFSDLLKAVAMLKTSLNGKFKLTIIGEGPEKENLHQIVADLNLDDCIVFKGAIPFDKIKPFYDRSDIFVLPCIVAENGDRDGIPNVILEAMCSGLAVVSTAVSGIPEVISDRVDGLLVPPHDIEALSCAMESLIKDGQLREMLGRMAHRKITDHFNKEDHINALYVHFQT